MWTKQSYRVLWLEFAQFRGDLSPMRWIFWVLTFFAFAPSAVAQTSIMLDADPVPVIDAQINGRPVRLEVDMRLPSMLALSASAAQRLHVTRVPLLAVGVGLEGSNSAIRGRLARPRVVFEGGDSRAFAGIFPMPVTSRADGVIGPGALPYDVVTIRLGPAQAGEREISFTLADANNWTPTTRIGDAEMRVLFDVSQQPSVFNRAAARHYDANGGIVSSGDLVEAPVILGLRTRMEPVTTALTMEGV